ncbi:glycosyltransferase family 4 protein [Halorussus ruber]|uniref:glycosyltransferase family 4 protein n=1 Tax=Halorussus ruber TaxID=1126238 RepID=UPI0010926893|nr:glycosyltransferase family 4 protein [Halorussus ruber]
MNGKIAFHLGDFSSFNVNLTTGNFGEMLSDTFQLDLISTNPDGLSPKVHRHFDTYGGNYPDTKAGSARALRAYLRGASPDVISQIGDVPVYGNIISLLKDDDSKFVCRYSGDLFYEYRLERGLRKAKIFALKNLVGRVPLRFADRAVTMGPREKEKIVRRGAEPTNVEILPPPIDVSRFVDVNPVLVEGLSADDPVVLFVGRVSRLKGAATLESTLPEILERRPDIQFVLVGDEQYSLDVPQEYSEQVFTVGRVNPSQVPSYYKMADLYVHPSLTEGVSRSVLEALACDTPVVVRDVGDLAYVTSNIFTTDDEFVNMVCDFERLPVENPDNFTIENLQYKYRRFFEEVIA